MPVLKSTTVMELAATLPQHPGDVLGLAVNNQTVVTIGGTLVHVFNREDLTEKSYSPLHLHKYHVISCAISRCGSKLICTSMDAKASITDLKSGKLLSMYSHPNGSGMRACCLSPNEQLLAVGATDGLISLMEMDTYKTLREMRNTDDESVLSLAFTPDSQWLLSGHSVYGDIRVWNAAYLSDKRAASVMAAHELGTHTLDMLMVDESDPDSARKTYKFVSGGEDSRLCLWRISYEEHSRIPKLTKLNTFIGHTSPVYSVKFSLDGKCVASCGGDLTVRLWNLDGECMYVHVDAHKAFVNSCAFSTDSKYIYTASSDKMVKVWRLTDISNLTDKINGEVSADFDEEHPVSTQNLDVVREDNSKRAEYSPTYNGRTQHSSILSWSVDDVGSWLNQLGLSKYREKFRSHEIDGQELIHINTDVITNEIGISAFGARNKILRGIQELLTSANAKRHESTDSKDVLQEFICPITHSIMNDPVVAADGYSYERNALESWFQKGKTTSPMTNAELAHQTLTPNHTLRALINRLNSQ